MNTKTNGAANRTAKTSPTFSQMVEKFRGKRQRDIKDRYSFTLSAESAAKLRELATMAAKKHGLKRWQAESAIVCCMVRRILTGKEASINW